MIKSAIRQGKDIRAHVSVGRNSRVTEHGVHQCQEWVRILQALQRLWGVNSEHVQKR